MIHSPLFWGGVFLLPPMMLLIGVVISAAVIQAYGAQS